MYPLACPTCVIAMTMLTPIPSTATPNQMRAILRRAPEANMVMLRALAKTTAVASSAHGSSGAEIEEDHRNYEQDQDCTEASFDPVCSRSLSWSRRPGGRCMSLTARTHTMWDQGVREPCNDERDHGDDQHGYNHLATLPVNPARSEGIPRSWVIAGRFNESSRGSTPVTTNGIEKRSQGRS